MIGTEGLLTDRQRPLEQRLRLGVIALSTVQLRQIVQAGRHVGMIGTEGLLIDRQRPLVQRLCLGVIALRVVQPRQIVQAGCQARIGRAELLRFFEGERVELERLGILAVILCLIAIRDIHVPQCRLSKAWGCGGHAKQDHNGKQTMNVTVHVRPPVSDPMLSLRSLTSKLFT